jgi:hypothetical protein
MLAGLWSVVTINLVEHVSTRDREPSAGRAVPTPVIGARVPLHG